MARRTRITERTAPQPRRAAGAPLPADVRLMNAVSAVVFALAVLGGLAAAGLGLARASVFTIRTIQIDGDLARNSVPTIRANALPSLAGSFFTLDLQRARRAFEQVPWVRHAVVRRIWPDRLAVRLEEHRAAALWEAGPGVERLVNDHGEVFEANVGDVEDEGLPSFAGPEGRAAQMLAFWRRLQPAYARQGWSIERLVLSGRGSWRAELDSGAAVEMGRGSDDEVAARTERFLHTVAAMSTRYRQPMEYADLRHAEGYALRLRGVSTTAPAGN